MLLDLKCINYEKQLKIGMGVTPWQSFVIGDAFVLRDPAGIRPAYFMENEEVIVVASERPVIQTVFNVTYESVQELTPGHALLIKKGGETEIKQIAEPLPKKLVL